MRLSPAARGWWIRRSASVALRPPGPGSAMTEFASISRATPARAQRWGVLPVLELATLVVALFLPLVLQDYLTVFATRVLILAIFALSFDLVWAMRASEFRSGAVLRRRRLRDGAAGTRSRHRVDACGAPAGILIGLVFALLLGGFLLLGRHPASVIFVALGRSPAPMPPIVSPAVVLSRRPERHSVHPADDDREL